MRRALIVSTSATASLTLLLAGVVTFTTTGHDHSAGDGHSHTHDTASMLAAGAVPDDRCGPEGYSLPSLATADFPACLHSDTPPAGLDVTRPVSVAELRTRLKGTPAAVAAAAEAGVSTPAAGQVANPAIPCDSDGVDGYRTQAMYVVESGKTNRYNDLKNSIQIWAATVDDVTNRSAAVTGGVRHVRYVHDAPVAGVCVPKILNVTVPAGSMANFNSTINAVKALGYTSPSRKYLMWTDATVLCGIATMYPDASPAASNANNGSNPQYARIDSGCWGLPESVEAHEHSHMLGSVLASAPHATNAGHCYDESDRLCYADGGGKAMIQVCSPDHEFLYDCNNDDYFHTSPTAGSFLATNWNTANSRFLMGTGPSTTYTPTTLEVAPPAINTPAIPGLSTEASITPRLPSAATLTSVTWTSSNKLCLITPTNPDKTQVSVVCPTTATGTTTLTATVTDSAGTTRIVKGTLALEKAVTGAPKRPITLTASLGGQPAGSLLCSASLPSSVTATDAATGKPIHGLAVQLTKKTTSSTGATVLTKVAGGTTGATGTAAVPALLSNALVLLPQHVTSTWYAPTTGAQQTVSSVPCTGTAVTTSHASTTRYAGPLTVTGTVTTYAAGQARPFAGAKLTAYVTSTIAGKTTKTAAGTTVASADGTYTLTAAPKTTGTLSVSAAGISGVATGTSSEKALTVTSWPTTLTGSIIAPATTYGGAVKIAGTLLKTTESGSQIPAGGVKVTAYLTPSDGTAPVLYSATTTATGTYSISAAVKKAGTLTLKVSAVPGYVDSTVNLGPVSLVSGVTLTFPTSLRSGTPTAVLATLTPARAGTIALQYSSDNGSTWSPITTIPAGVKTNITLTGYGTFKVRATFAGDAVAGPGTSLVKTFKLY